VARGWESKSVEEQQAEATSPKTKAARPLTHEERVRDRERQGLLLSRAHLLQQLEAAHHPRRQQMLQAAIADLDAKLTRLG
jgi:hypothetical protein